MEEIRTKTEGEEVKYKATEGTMFNQKQHCIDYEDTAACIIRSRVNITTSTQWDLCFGDEDHTVEFVTGKADNVKMYVALRKKECDFHSGIKRIDEFLASDISDDDTTIIIENCEGVPYAVTTVKNYIKKIQETINQSVNE